MANPPQEVVESTQFACTNSIKEREDNDLDMVLFPNPAGDQLNVELKGNTGSAVQYQLINALGMILQEGTFENGQAINISALASGHYILKAETGGAKYQREFVKR